MENKDGHNKGQAKLTPSSSQNDDAKKQPKAVSDKNSKASEEGKNRGLLTC